MSNSKLGHELNLDTKGKISSSQVNIIEKFTEEEMSTIHELFDSLDHKSSNELDVKQCIYLFRLLLIPIDNEEQFHLLMNQVDLDNNGKISFEEFLILLTKKVTNAQNINIIFETFKYFDKDNDGFINIHDLSKIFFNLGEKFNEEKLNEILLTIDYDQDGFISYQDFIQMTKNISKS
jgi:Ca2+-binding EF-hand superfamily protein